MASSTREKILAVSLRLFNEQGYRNVTMRAIADALSISVGNLTYHFAKKQDIVAALMDDVFAQIDSLFSMMLDTLERCAFFLSRQRIEAGKRSASSGTSYSPSRAPDRREAYRAMRQTEN